MGSVSVRGGWCVVAGAWWLVLLVLRWLLRCVVAGRWRWGEVREEQGFMWGMLWGGAAQVVVIVLAW
jgi:hypothetical protein